VAPPQTSSFSATMTFNPCHAATTAADSPAAPEPTTRRSHSTSGEIVFIAGVTIASRSDPRWWTIFTNAPNVSNATRSPALGASRLRPPRGAAKIRRRPDKVSRVMERLDERKGDRYGAQRRSELGPPPAERAAHRHGGAVHDAWNREAV